MSHKLNSICYIYFDITWTHQKRQRMKKVLGHTIVFIVALLCALLYEYLFEFTLSRFFIYYDSNLEAALCAYNNFLFWGCTIISIPFIFLCFIPLKYVRQKTHCNFLMIYIVFGFELIDILLMLISTIIDARFQHIMTIILHGVFYVAWMSIFIYESQN